MKETPKSHRTIAPALGVLLLLAPACGEPALQPPMGGTGGNGEEEILDPVCEPGEVESRVCGPCDSGVTARACDHRGQWSDWGDCVGEERGYPRRLSDDEPLCPPYHRPAVFLSPHPDDETLGMGGAIVQHVEAGRDVFIELLTRGEATGVLNVLADGGECSWHEGAHEHELSAAEIGDARVAEFRAAAEVLGVTGAHVSSFPDGALTTADVRERITFWLEHGGEDLSLKGTAGLEDPRPSGSPHPDHAAVWDALVGSGFGDVRGYLVSHYVTGSGHSYRNVNIEDFCETKREALLEYQVWNPDAGRFAIGYHSARAIFDAAHEDCREFIVVPD